MNALAEAMVRAFETAYNDGAPLPPDMRAEVLKSYMVIAGPIMAAMPATATFSAPLAHDGPGKEAAT